MLAKVEFGFFNSDFNFFVSVFSFYTMLMNVSRQS
jgi:hypothetical protein